MWSLNLFKFALVYQFQEADTGTWESNGINLNMNVRPARKSVDLTKSAPHKNPNVYCLYEDKFKFQVDGITFNRGCCNVGHVS